MPEKEAKPKKLDRLCIACGGTGGHFYPGLTLARELQDSGGKALLLLSGKQAPAQIKIAADFGIDSVLIKAAQPTAHPIRFLVFAWRSVIGLLLSIREILRFRPQALLSMGSFNAVPPSLAAFLCRVPLYLHDGNARIGKANLFLSRFAKHMGVAFPPVNEGKCRCPFTCTGMPVRPELLKGKMSRKDAIAKLNEHYDCKLRGEVPILLIFGGSQGAAVLNSVVPEALMNQDAYDFQVIHLTGDNHYHQLKESYQNSPFRVLVLDRTDVMECCYAAAGMIICRSGGSTLAELAVYSRFAVLVPFPYAADGHQYDNADYYASSNAAYVVEDDEFTVDLVAELVAEWRADPDHYQEKGIFASLLARYDATDDIFRMIEAGI